MQTGTKLLNAAQRQAARIVFGPAMGEQIVKAAQGEVDQVTTRLGDLVAQLNQVSKRLTKLEIERGIGLAASYFQKSARRTGGIGDKIFRNNGKPAGGSLAAKIYGGKK